MSEPDKLLTLSALQLARIARTKAARALREAIRYIAAQSQMPDADRPALTEIIAGLEADAKRVEEASHERS